jgi:hypothetical protein
LSRVGLQTKARMARDEFIKDEMSLDGTDRTARKILRWGTVPILSTLPPREPHVKNPIRAQSVLAHEFGHDSPPFSHNLESTPFGVLFRSSSTLHERVCANTLYL